MKLKKGGEDEEERAMEVGRKMVGCSAMGQERDGGCPRVLLPVIEWYIWFCVKRGGCVRFLSASTITRMLQRLLQLPVQRYPPTHELLLNM